LAANLGLFILKQGWYLIIHDELKDHEKKIAFIGQSNCTLIDFFYLDESIWWNNYYKPLDDRIKKIMYKDLKDSFRSDVSEIDFFKINPEVFRSVYYIIRTNFQ